VAIETNSDYDPTVPTGEEDEVAIDDGENDLDMIIMKSLQRIGNKTCLFISILDNLQRLCYMAKEWVADYTLFNNPFLSSLEILNLIHEAWKRVEDAEKNY